jgi:hypothetical protein
MEFSISLRNTDPFLHSLPDTFKVFTDEITNSFQLFTAGGNKRATDNLEWFSFYIYKKPKIQNVFRHRKNPPLHQISLQGQGVIGD